MATLNLLDRLDGRNALSLEILRFITLKLTKSLPTVQCNYQRSISRLFFTKISASLNSKAIVRVSVCMCVCVCVCAYVCVCV